MKTFMAKIDIRIEKMVCSRRYWYDIRSSGI